MASVSPGKRLWTCPQCGNQFELSATQLDPIACDACLNQMKAGGRRNTKTGAGALGLWAGLPEVVKLGVVLVAFLVGLWLGYLFGKAWAPKSKVVEAPISHAPLPPATRSLPPASEPTKDAQADSDEPAKGEDSEDRPPAPGPNYHWVRGRILKDGSRGKGYWAKNRTSESSP